MTDIKDDGKFELGKAAFQESKNQILVDLSKASASNLSQDILDSVSEGRNAKSLLKELQALLGSDKYKNPQELIQPSLRDSGSVLDRVKPINPSESAELTQESGFQNPLPKPKPPRSTVVGPGSISASGIASQEGTTQTFIVQDSNHPNPIRMYVREQGDSSAYVEYDATTGDLISWSTQERSSDGTTRGVRTHVEQTQSGERVVVVEKTVTSPNGETTTTVVDKRPYGAPGDFPLTDPRPARSMTGDESQSSSLPLGIEYNPITGQYTRGLKLDNNQVNPGKQDTSQVQTGPKLAIDPKDLVINPDLANISEIGKIKPIKPIGPGERPPNGEGVPPRT
ncbi:hypothetical protein [Pseudanabaena sp. ABRG5-3]|uniref:hypothetical protein n=1 Tax=Pseudanabaena sp. ABRG5-3 TaxID=685565 RepID=UPI000DC71271|nr:hypothetical protein [Pseudanabaena sp. ABRG5-3]BBC26488.1 hypothetical protein ABRG53_4231 [Pseudanabaena sp. ABRG5-3]